MTGIKFTLRDMKNDYKFTGYSDPISLIVVSEECIGLAHKQIVKAVGCYRIGDQYYYAVRTENINEFTMLEIENFQILF